MKRALTTAAAAAGLILAAAGHADAALFINEATGPFTPSFRGQPNNTTHFGWQGSYNTVTRTGFDNDPAVEGSSEGPITNPVPTINPSTAGVGLIQTTTADILSGSNNIYGGPAAVKLTLTAPTAGSAGTGFTTIILQGRGLNTTGFPGLMDTLGFESVNGVAPQYASGVNAAGEHQFWAKFELPGNQSSYAIKAFGTGGNLGVTSITDLIVDTQWSPTGFATDAAVPEPASLGALGVAA